MSTLRGGRTDRDSRSGQALVLVAFIMMVLLTGVGVAIDASNAYYYSSTVERAAAAAALSGVIFMPNQYLPSQAIPAGSTNDATDRAKAEAVRNGHGVTSAGVTVSQVANQPTQLQVTVSVSISSLFMRVLGINSYTVARTAIAEYLTPISLGQPGSQAGSTVSQLGSGGNNYYFMRTLGWDSDRANGDPFSPNPAIEYALTLSPSSPDVHVISSTNEVNDANLPARGGYNFLVTLPAGGGYIQVYNAAQAPDGNGGLAHNYCENNKTGGRIAPCSSGGSYYYHEEDGLSFLDDTSFMAMEYTLFQVNNTFIHSTDTMLAQMKVLPIDASRWNSSNQQYTNIVTNAKITQTYNANGTPSNMLIYHNWIDVATYSGASDSGLVKRILNYGSALLPAGTYRLRVDALNYDGTLPPGNGSGRKGYAVRALDSTGSSCAACTVGATADMCFHTPMSTSGGGAFTIPIFQLPAAYAGRTISVDVYDAGDISGGGNVDIRILDPSGNVVTAVSPQTVDVTNLGTDRSTPANDVLIQSVSTATYRATSSGTILYNGRWVEMEVPIPSTYSPGTGSTTFSMQYVTSSGVTSTDTLTVAVGLAGAPAHLLVT